MRTPKPPTHHRAIHVVLCFAVLFGMSLAAWHPAMSSGVTHDHGDAFGLPSVGNAGHAHDTDLCPLCVAIAHAQSISSAATTLGCASAVSDPNVDAKPNSVTGRIVLPALPRAPPQA